MVPLVQISRRQWPLEKFGLRMEHPFLNRHVTITIHRHIERLADDDQLFILVQHFKSIHIRRLSLRLLKFFFFFLFLCLRLQRGQIPDSEPRLKISKKNEVRELLEVLVLTLLFG